MRSDTLRIFVLLGLQGGAQLEIDRGVRLVSVLQTLADHHLLVIVYILGLTATNHLMAPNTKCVFFK